MVRWIPSHKSIIPHQDAPRLYDHVTALWNYEGWLPEDSVEYSRAHYAAYMVKRTDGLRIISLNTNLCMSASELRSADISNTFHSF